MNSKKEYLKELGQECFDKLKELNPSGGIKEFIRIAVEFGYNKAKEKRVYVSSVDTFEGDWEEFSDEDFKEEAYHNYSLEEFAKAFNDEKVNTDWDIIRII